MTDDWRLLQAHYESCLNEFGVTPLGVDWPNARDLEVRFATQLGVLDAVPPDSHAPVLLDLGCGPGLLLDYLTASGRTELIQYRGIDISPTMIDAAKSRWPLHAFEARNILTDPLPPQSVDVVLMNGVLTERQGIPRERMVEMAEALIISAFRSARHGVVFNSMSKHVDWERDDLFHWSFDEVAAFLKRAVTPHIRFRADYGLYEFTTFAWHAPLRTGPSVRQDWWHR